MGMFDFIGDIFGGNKSGGSDAAASSQDFLISAARDFFNKTMPVRDAMFSQLGNFMQSGWDPTTSAMWDPLKANVENNFATARNNIMSNVPAGGALLENLADTETSKANTLSGLAGNMIQDMLNKSYGIATNQGYTNSAAQAGGIANQAYSGGAQNQMANVAGLGGLMNLGAGLGSGLGSLGSLGSSLAGLLGAGGMFFSSKDYKDDIENLPEGTALDALSKIRPVTYKYKPEFGGQEAIGVIAEEIEKILPVAVKRPKINGKQYTMVDYMALVPLLVKGLQEQQKQINALG